MKKISLFTIKALFLPVLFVACIAEQKGPPVKLIAHRGGVVENGIPENSREALLRASEKGYWGVELDAQMTKDSILIAHHDRDFKRYYGLDRQVSETRWTEISELVSPNGTRVQTLEEALSLCADLGLNVMIDNKVPGLPITVFENLLQMLDSLQLREKALMIGNSESTDFFTGKIALSCTKEQLEQNMLRLDYDPANYYFFGNPTPEDAEWAKKNNIMIVGVINEWALDKETEQEEAERIKQNIRINGIEYVQLDSKYDALFLTGND